MNGSVSSKPTSYKKRYMQQTKSSNKKIDTTMQSFNKGAVQQIKPSRNSIPNSSMYSTLSNLMAENQKIRNKL